MSSKQIVLKYIALILCSCTLGYAGKMTIAREASPIAANAAGEELTIAEVNSIARQTTVMIAPGLTPELVRDLEENRNNPLASSRNPDGVWNPGSGVIIAKEGRTYYVLTVTHNFKQRYLEENIAHGIRTSDGEVHVVKQINDGRGCPLGGTPRRGQRLLRFGCYSINVPGRVTGSDLAVVSFESEKDYPVAALGDPEAVKLKDRIYASGWPDPEKEKDPQTGKCRGQVKRRQRRLTWGPVMAKLNNLRESEFGWGYGIFYIDNTRPGMSGGPVFDRYGRVVGVHGRGSGDKQALVKQYCSVPENRQTTQLESEDIDILVARVENAQPTNLSKQFSSGQNLSFFLELTQQTGINLAYNRQQLPDELIEKYAKSSDCNISSDRDRDFGICEEIIGAIDDRNDVEKNIYKKFMSSALKDCPTGVLIDVEGCDDEW